VAAAARSVQDQRRWWELKFTEQRASSRQSSLAMLFAGIFRPNGVSRHTPNGMKKPQIRGASVLMGKKAEAQKPNRVSARCRMRDVRAMRYPAIPWHVDIRYRRRYALHHHCHTTTMSGLMRACVCVNAIGAHRTPTARVPPGITHH
jgi:hypothetical protein